MRERIVVLSTYGRAASDVESRSTPVAKNNLNPAKEIRIPDLLMDITQKGDAGHG